MDQAFLSDWRDWARKNGVNFHELSEATRGEDLELRIQIEGYRNISESHDRSGNPSLNHESRQICFFSML